MDFAGLQRLNNKRHRYSMRNVRCVRATEWVMKCAECRILGDIEPPNPLQHEGDAATIIKHYALQGAANPLEARRRCWEKYPARMEALKPNPVKL